MSTSTASALAHHPAAPASEACPPEQIRNPQSEIRNAFPLHAFPEPLRAFPAALAAAAPVSIEFAAAACLGVLAAALGSGARCRDGERLILPNLYLLTVAPDGLAKSLALQRAFAPLARHQALRDTLPPKPENNDAADEAEATDTEDTPPAPLCLQQVPRNKLLPTLAGRPAESLALFHPQAHLPVQILRGAVRSSIDEDVLLAAHSGSSFATARRVDGHASLRQPCLTLHWSITPHVWRDLLSARTLRNSPLLPRFLVVPESETCAQDIPLDLPAIPAAATQLWAETIAALLPLREAAEPLEFTLAPEARRILRAYENEIRHTLLASTDPLEETYASHLPDTAHRLALLLHTATIAPSLKTSEPDKTPNPTTSNKKTASPSQTVASQNPEPGTRNSEPAAEPGTRNSEPAAPLNPELSAASAHAAIALTRWFAAQQAALLAHFHQQADELLLDRLTRSLNRSGGWLTLGQIADRHNLTPAAIDRLVEKFPHLLALVETDPAAPGPKSQILALRAALPGTPAVPSPTAPAVPTSTAHNHPAPPCQPPPIQSPTPTQSSSPNPVSHRPATPRSPLPTPQPNPWQSSESSERSVAPHPRTAQSLSTAPHPNPHPQKQAA